MNVATFTKRHCCPFARIVAGKVDAVGVKFTSVVTTLNKVGRALFSVKVELVKRRATRLARVVGWSTKSQLKSGTVVEPLVSVHAALVERATNVRRMRHNISQSDDT